MMPNKKEILNNLQEHIKTLRRSYTCRRGKHKGWIHDSDVRFDIACLKAAIRVVEKSP